MPKFQYCRATVAGVPVFVELTGEQLYGDDSQLVPVFHETGGELQMFEVAVKSLQDLQPE